MATVKITSQLASKLQGTDFSPTMLVQLFSDWKDNGEYSSYFFSHAKTENGLSHVHMVPVTPGNDLDSWNKFWNSRQEHRRRSDCYVLYAHDRTHGNLLINVLFDPGAHELWKPAARSQLESYEAVADNFITYGIVP